MSNDCSTVYDLWTNWGKATAVDRNSQTACCRFLGNTQQLTGIEGVKCTSDGNVTWVLWSSKSLSGSIPESIGNLKNLRLL
jgi:hypothetical protein